MPDGIQAGKVFFAVELVDKGFNKGIASADKKMAKLSKTIQTASLAISAFAVTAGVALFKVSSSAMESENLFSLSMGKMSDSARKWSKDFSDSLGLNDYSVRQTMALFNNFITNMGIVDSTALEMSKTLTALGYDLQSAFGEGLGLTLDNVFEKLRSGLRGETEGVEVFGINLLEANVKSYAYANGIAKIGEELSESQKVMARFGIMLKSTSKIQGDFANTIDSPANKLMRLKEGFEKTKIELGMAFMPVFESALDLMKEFSGVLKVLVDGLNLIPKPLRTLITGTVALTAALAGGVAVLGMAKSGWDKLTGSIIASATASKFTAEASLGVSKTLQEIIDVLNGKLPTASAKGAAGLKVFGATGWAAAGYIGLMVAAVAALAAGIYYLATAEERHRKSIENRKKEIQKEKEQLPLLIEEYETLRDKTDKTAAEKERYRDVIDQILKIQPDMLDSYDAEGNAILNTGRYLEGLIRIRKEELKLRKEEIKLDIRAAEREKKRIQQEMDMRRIGEDRAPSGAYAAAYIKRKWGESEEEYKKRLNDIIERIKNKQIQTTDIQNTEIEELDEYIRKLNNNLEYIDELLGKDVTIDSILEDLKDPNKPTKNSVEETTDSILIMSDAMDRYTKSIKLAEINAKLFGEEEELLNEKFKITRSSLEDLNREYLDLLDERRNLNKSDDEYKVKLAEINGKIASNVAGQKQLIASYGELKIKVDAANKSEEDYLALCDEIIRKNEEWAESTQNIDGYLNNFIYAMSNIYEYQSTVSEDMIRLAEDTAYGMYDAWNSLFMDAFEGDADLLSNFWDNITRSIYQSFANMLSQMVTESFIAMFRIRTNMAMSGYSSDSYHTPLNYGGARAAGGPVYSGKSYIVGEKGPEILHMGSASGRIIPNSQLGGSPNVTVNILNQSGERLEQKSSETSVDNLGNIMTNIVVDVINTGKGGVHSTIKRLARQG